MDVPLKLVDVVQREEGAGDIDDVAADCVDVELAAVPDSDDTIAVIVLVAAAVLAPAALLVLFKLTLSIIQ